MTMDKQTLADIHRAAIAVARDGRTDDEWFYYLQCVHHKNVLALLDELDKYQKYAKERDAENESLALTVGRLRIELEAAEKRIAELEARTVTLPPTFWYEHDDLSRDIPVLDKRLVKKAIRAAGISIKGSE
ncbi:ead/Ea22-like family protein [Yokenella regensburgei]|uniref:ead/Ea22-like family protein n=1 Tax=Yokenella regensburgei TaxID=158877 RepID=UPI002899A4A4|nr:ead/Ea22-like family protein [Yokenella regensburgei]